MDVAQRVLIVDDDPLIRRSLSEALSEIGIDVHVSEDAEHALSSIGSIRPDIVLSDVRMPGMSGLELLGLLRDRSPDTHVVLMTAFDDMPTIVSAMRGGALEFLVKPVDLHDLRRLIQRVFDDRRALRKQERDDAPPPLRLNELIGRDARMIAVYKLVGQAAATRATVLIRGESGTGKELVARAIHANSASAAEPFIAVNCAAIPSTLLESELFGHTRGAFTGAHQARRGRFALAGSGTIFLDEIGDTTLDFQSKLLRVLQDREFHPVGSEGAEPTDARVIAATHQNIEAMASERRFREDLYYRLRVIEITIPPLRERPADIPLLAEHMIRRASASLGVTPAALSSSAIDVLLAHTWPGNVRELENGLMRAVVIATAGVVRAEHLSITEQRAPETAELSSLEALEREHVKRVLAATGGQKGRAARILGVSRPRLNRLLQKYDLD